MNKFLKFSVSLLLVGILAFSVFTIVPCAAENTVISLSKNDIAVGDTVKVTVTVNVKNMFAINLSLKYDKEIFEYVSGATRAGSGTAKIVEDLSGDANKSYIITFKSLKTGTASFRILGSVGAQSSAGAMAKDVTLEGNTPAIGVHTFKTESVTPATLSKNGKLVKKCTVCGETVSSAIRYIKSVTLSTSAYTYNGQVKKPTVTVKNTAGTTISSKYYTVTYATGRKYVGSYKVTVKFKGNYSGTKNLYFKILPPKTTVSKLTSGTKSIKVSITKKTSQVSGYQVQYSTSKTFSSYKTKTLPGNANTGIYLTSLSAKRTYYVRVRTYKTVSGTKYYSLWSAYKYVITK